MAKQKQETFTQSFHDDALSLNPWGSPFDYYTGLDAFVQKWQARYAREAFDRLVRSIHSANKAGEKAEMVKAENAEARAYRDAIKEAQAQGVDLSAILAFVKK